MSYSLGTARYAQAQADAVGGGLSADTFASRASALAHLRELGAAAVDGQR